MLDDPIIVRLIHINSHYIVIDPIKSLFVDDRKPKVSWSVQWKMGPVTGKPPWNGWIFRKKHHIRPNTLFCTALESYFQHLSTYQLNIIDNRNLRDEFRYSPMGFSVEAHRCLPLGCVGSSWFPSKTNLNIANLIMNMKMCQNMSNHTSNVAM